MKNIRSFNENLDIENKKVIVRSDFNVPIKNKIIQDKTRINLSIPFIQNLLDRKQKYYLFLIWEDQKVLKDKSLSLRPIFSFLQEKINNKIHFYSDKITQETKDKISFLSNGEIIFENIRFNEGEVTNDEKFAKNLSSLGDIFY